MTGVASGMFTGFSQATIDYMWHLRMNNNKLWFDEHKEDFQREFQSPMKALGQDVFEQLTANNGKYGFRLKLSRIYKDARRVRGGEPYRTNLWFTIERPSEDSASSPVFWFDLSPEDWSYGMGYYQARPMTMAKLRTRIDNDTKRFEKLVSVLDKQSEFVLDGDEYARKKESPTVKTAEWYNKKSFSLIHSQSNGNELFSSEFAERLLSGYRFLMPFYEYFSTIDSDPDPKQLG